MDRDGLNNFKKIFLKKRICINCQNEIRNNIEKCQFCEDFGGNDPEKLLKIKNFSNGHFSRGYQEGLSDFIDLDID